MGQFEARGVAPEVLEGVEAAFLSMEDVDDDVAVIDDDPMAHGVAIDCVGRDAVIVLEALHDLAGDSLEVRLGGAATNDEEIGEVRYASQIDRNDVLRLFIGGQLRAARGQFCASQDE